MICNKEHRFLEDFKQLPDSQGGELRHKCAGCAFERGFWDAICWKSMANPSELESKLPDSQAGTVRHKDAYEAYKHG
ncbi:MAG: hypothetical protein J5706_05395, partial [Elusimicrobiales bacterium]|nr:hypothetical protein [Elusimicrobiales bacterium]